MSLMEVEHKVGDENRCQAGVNTGKHDIMCTMETLNGSEILATHDEFVNGVCRKEFWATR